MLDPPMALPAASSVAPLVRSVGDPSSVRERAAEAADGDGEPVAPASAVVRASVTVTASREEKDTFEEPVVVEVLDDESIRQRKKIGNFVDLFDEIAGVAVQKTARGQGSPFIRGFTGFHNLMMIDGVRLNNSVMRSGPNQYWTTIDALGAERVELVKGPGSVLYGSDAVGGTANVITRSFNPLGEPGWHAEGGVFMRWGSAERSIVTRAEVAGSHGRHLSYGVGASFKDHGDLRAGGATGTVHNSAHDERGFDAKLQYATGGGGELVLLLQSFRQEDVPRTETTVFSKPFRGTRVGTELKRDHDQERRLSYLKYHRRRSGARVEEAEITLSLQQTLEDRIRIRGDSRSDISGFDVATLGVQTEFRSVGRWGRWTYGSEYYRDSVDSFRTDFNADGTVRRIRVQGPIADDAEYQVVGVYVQNERNFAADRLTLSLGGRLSHASLSAGRVEDPESGLETSLADSWSTGLGSIRAIWRLAPEGDDRWRLFGSVAQAFRAPNLSDITRLDATSAVETLTPGLEPERYLALEVGAKGRSDAVQLTASLFRTFIDDQIVQSPTGRLIEGTPEVQKSNVGDGFIQGAEASVDWQATPRSGLWVNLSWTEGEVDQFLFDEIGSGSEVRAPASRLIPWMAHGGLTFRARSRPAWIEIYGTAFSKADRLALRDVTDTRRIPPGGTPGFALLGVRGAIELAARRLTLAYGVENLFDEDYRIHGSGQNMPGRNLALSLEWRSR